MEMAQAAHHPTSPLPHLYVIGKLLLLLFCLLAFMIKARDCI